MTNSEHLKNLLEPYSDGGRYTPEKQVAWLLRQGFSQVTIDAAMSDVYFGISQGTTYEDGHAVDRELLRVANEYRSKEAEAVVSALATVKKQIEGTKLQKLWWVLKGEM
jgi:hypothetical protein